MVECLAVEISTAIPPGQMSGVDSNVIRRHVSNSFDGNSEQVSPGRI
jgi:hypothetical protein